jgi:hypothetical protein
MKLSDAATDRQQIRADRQHRHAASALDLAHCQHHNGTTAALAWASAGRPSRGIGPEDVAMYIAARGIVESNGGMLRDGDVGRLVAAMVRKGGRS